MLGWLEPNVGIFSLGMYKFYSCYVFSLLGCTYRAAEASGSLFQGSATPVPWPHTRVSGGKDRAGPTLASVVFAKLSYLLPICVSQDPDTTGQNNLYLYFQRGGLSFKIWLWMFRNNSISKLNNFSSILFYSVFH